MKLSKYKQLIYNCKVLTRRCIQYQFVFSLQEVIKLVKFDDNNTDNDNTYEEIYQHVYFS